MGNDGRFHDLDMGNAGQLKFSPSPVVVVVVIVVVIVIVIVIVVEYTVIIVFNRLDFCEDDGKDDNVIVIVNVINDRNNELPS